MYYAKELAPNLFNSYGEWFRNYKDKAGREPSSGECAEAVRYFGKEEIKMCNKTELLSWKEYEKILMEKLSKSNSNVAKLKILAALSETIASELELEQKIKEDDQNG